MSLLIKTIALSALLFMAGCASTPQQPVSFAVGTIEASEKIGILLAVPKETTMTYPGAGCLLCLAAAATANSGVSKHAKTFSVEDIASLGKLVEKTLGDQNIDAVVIDEPIVWKSIPKLKKTKETNKAKRDFSKYKSSHGVSHIAVIEINFAGLQRSYSSYVPTSDPQAVILGATYMIDLSTHTYDLFSPISQFLSASGNWKEGENYPGLTNAYYQAIENVRDQVAKSYTASETKPALTTTTP